MLEVTSKTHDALIMNHTIKTKPTKQCYVEQENRNLKNSAFQPETLMSCLHCTSCFVDKTLTTCHFLYLRNSHLTQNTEVNQAPLCVEK